MEKLSPTELRILDLVSLGGNSGAIARQIGKSEDTVKSYLRHVYRKAGGRGSGGGGAGGVRAGDLAASAGDGDGHGGGAVVGAGCVGSAYRGVFRGGVVSVSGAVDVVMAG